MRRAIAAAVMGGLLLGGAVATPSVAAARGGGKAPSKARSAAPAKPRVGSAAVPSKAAHSKTVLSKTVRRKAVTGKAATNKAATAMKTVVYAGYEFQVPASWPVYRLDEHPQTCVRYDVHAVYLGTPGTDMRCPAGLVGRTQTVSLIPGKGAAAGPAAVRQPARRAGPAGRHRAAAAGRGPRHDHAERRQPRAEGRARRGGRQARRSLVPTGRTRQSSSRCSTPCAWLRQAPRRPHSPRRCRPSLAVRPPDQPKGRAVGAARAACLAARVRRGCTGVTAAAQQRQRRRRHQRQRSRRPPAGAEFPPTGRSRSSAVAPPSPSRRPPPPKPSPTPFHPVSGFDTCTAPSTVNDARLAQRLRRHRRLHRRGERRLRARQPLRGLGEVRGQHGLGAAADLRRAAGAVLGRRQRGADQPGQRRRAGQRGRGGRGQRRPVTRPARGLADLLRHGGLQRRHQLHERGAHVPRRLGPPGGRQRGT